MQCRIQLALAVQVPCCFGGLQGRALYVGEHPYFVAAEAYDNIQRNVMVPLCPPCTWLVVYADTEGGLTTSRIKEMAAAVLAHLQHLYTANPSLQRAEAVGIRQRRHAQNATVH